MRRSVFASALRVAQRWRDAHAASYRVPHVIPFGHATGRPPRILYLCPDSATPSGGVRVIYRHVDLLNELGFDAAVVHSRRGFRAHWFDNTTTVVAAPDVVATTDDVLVVPELYGAHLSRLQDGPRLVLFNQGAYYTFSGLRVEEAAVLRQAPVEAILTVSEDSLQMLRSVFEDTPVHYVRSVLDGAIFHPPDDVRGRRRIAYVTTRRDVERHHLLSMLESRGRLSGWDRVAVEGLSERHVAEALRSSAIFLSFSALDGFGLPPAEAMACGCYVVGFHGQGGKEYFDPAYCRAIADAGLLAFTRAVEESAAAYDRDPEQFSAAGLQASRAVLQRYHLAGLREDLLAFYATLGLEPDGCGRRFTRRRG